jgi:mono/diheme cytochrome c family protein
MYNKSCGNCHGTDLLGRGPRAAGMVPPPQPLVGPDRAPLPPAALIHIVTHGSPGTAMAPWGRAFTDAQVRDVVAFVWARKAAAEAED